MRCKPGDLAIVVGPGVATPGLAFRLVIVDCPAHPGDAQPDGLRIGDGAPAWWCRAAVEGATLPFLAEVGDTEYWAVVEVLRRPIADQILRPIRPNDGVDESLSWTTKELQHG